MKKYFFLFLTLFCFLILNAQKKGPNLKFGSVTPADFGTKVYSIDRNAQAIVLFDYRDALYEGSNTSFFNVVYNYRKRIHLLNKNSFDLATVEIALYKYGLEVDQLEKLEAATYNLENGVVVKTKLDKSAVFKDKVSKNEQDLKFTFSNIKEGSIIEYSYSVNSPTANRLRDWYFQEAYPILWSECNIHVPSYFQFVGTSQGFQKFAIDTVSFSNESYNILFPGESAMDRSEVGRINMATMHRKWAIENVPAIKKENFVTTIANHVAKLNFQLVAYRPPNAPVKTLLGTWEAIAKDLMKDEEFGAELSKNNNWFDDELKKVIGKETNNKVKTKKVFEYIRDNYICTSHDYFYTKQGLKKVFQAKKGNVAELNLLLVAMLRSLNIYAKPIVLSTRENGFASETYPMINQFNYTICKTIIDDKEVLLDASHPKLGFGKLIADCYNGYARTIDTFPRLINLSADSVKEEKLTSVFIVNDEKLGMYASYTSTLGQFESFELREQTPKEKVGDYFTQIKKSYGFEIDLSNTSLDSLLNYEEPVAIKYDFSFKPDEEIIYFNPLLTEGLKNNPFKSAERFYPVEMPYTQNETYVLNIETPKGYTIDEIPKSARVKLNDDDGMFEYIIGKTNDGIQLRTSIKIKKANFLPEDYDTLRDFFGYIVKKHDEQIVYKKAK